MKSSMQDTHELTGLYIFIPCIMIAFFLLVYKLLNFTIQLILCSPERSRSTVDGRAECCICVQARRQGGFHVARNPPPFALVVGLKLISYVMSYFEFHTGRLDESTVQTLEN